MKHGLSYHVVFEGFSRFHATGVMTLMIPSIMIDTDFHIWIKSWKCWKPHGNMKMIGSHVLGSWTLAVVTLFELPGASENRQMTSIEGYWLLRLTAEPVSVTCKQPNGCFSPSPGLDIHSDLLRCYVHWKKRIFGGLQSPRMPLHYRWSEQGFWISVELLGWDAGFKISFARSAIVPLNKGSHVRLAR